MDLFVGQRHQNAYTFDKFLSSLLFSKHRMSVFDQFVVAVSICIFPVFFLSMNTKISEIADNNAEVRYTRLYDTGEG